jgi:hypothetical protein
MKIKGSELLRFLDDETGGWPQEPTPQCWYWDHEEFENEPNGEPNPDVVYDTDALGDVMFQGDSVAGVHYNDDPTKGDGYSLPMLIRRWRKAQTVTVLELEVKKEEVDYVRKVIKNLGLGKIITKLPPIRGF